MTNAEVSVVIPAHDAELTLRRAVRSALTQSLPPLEVIVVDDASTDGTAGIVKEMRDKRVILLGTQGVGAGGARNAGIKRARGKWVGFLDADDWWHPELLANFRRAVAATPEPGLCFAAAVPVDDSGRTVGHHPMVQGDLSFEALLSGEVVPTVSATVARVDAIQASGGFDESLEHPAGIEDIDLWLRLAQHVRCVGVAVISATYVVNDERDRHRTRQELFALERDRERVVRRHQDAIPRRLFSRSLAVMRARTARYWLRAGEPTEARRCAWQSLRTRPTLEGGLTLIAAFLPSALREQARENRRRWRSRHVMTR